MHNEIAESAKRIDAALREAEREALTPQAQTIILRELLRQQQVHSRLLLAILEAVSGSNPATPPGCS